MRPLQEVSNAASLQLQVEPIPEPIVLCQGIQTLKALYTTSSSFVQPALTPPLTSTANLVIALRSDCDSPSSSHHSDSRTLRDSDTSYEDTHLSASPCFHTPGMPSTPHSLPVPAPAPSPYPLYTLAHPARLSSNACTSPLSSDHTLPNPDHDSSREG
jgi:hypothetical protein